MRSTSRCIGLALALLVGAVVPLVAHAAPPTIQCPPAQVTYEFGGASFLVTASDPDGDPVELSVANLPRRASLDAPSGWFSWVPDDTQAGTHSIEFRATAGGETAACLVTITVVNYDLLPRIVCPAPGSVERGDTLAVQFTATDDDNDPLTFAMTPLPPGATLSPGGSVVWDTAQVTEGTYSFQVRVSDGTLAATCAWSVVVTASATLPILECPGSQTLTRGQSLAFVILASGGVAPITPGASDLPAGATFDAGTGRFSWTPTLDQSGAYLPRFTATTALGASVSCTVPISVLDTTAQPPTILCSPSRTLQELQPLSFRVAAFDPQGSALVLSVVPLPAGAQFSPTTRWFSWTPSPGQAGTYDLRFTDRKSVV